MKRRLLTLLLMPIFLFLLVACGGSEANGPAQTVERYLQAKVDGDADTIRQLLCADMESFYEREARTFDSVSGVQLEEMACEQAGDTQVVVCSGRIVAQYGTEETVFPLTAYAVVEEGGDWKWCGETVQ